MIEILPIRLLTDQDSPIFGSLNVNLGKLSRVGLSVGQGIVITPPEFKLKTVLEHYDFGSKEIFEQSLNLVKKEINSIPIPEILQREINKHRHLFVNGVVIRSARQLWQTLLHIWIEEVKDRLWTAGFYKGVTEGLEPQLVIFVRKLETFGTAHFDSFQDDVVINIESGKLHPTDLKNVGELVKNANKKLFIPHEYGWILDGSVKLAQVLPYTPAPVFSINPVVVSSQASPDQARSAVKVFFNLSTGFTIEKGVDGIFIASEKIFDLNKPNESFESLTLKLVESSVAFPTLPVLFKLADISEGMGKIRGTLRLLHQKSLFQPMIDTLDFLRHKKGLTNIHIVVPFVRGINEFLQIKRNLAVNKLSRKNSLELWLETAVPENIVNLEDYLVAGLDGIVLNLDELIALLNGFDTTEQELTFYKNEVKGLIKFLEDGLKLLHKAKIPFIAYGRLSLYPLVLEFLVERGVYGIVIERYEVTGAHELLHQAEKRVIHTHL